MWDEYTCLHESALHVSIAREISTASANICFLAVEVASSLSSVAVFVNHVAPRIERQRGQIYDAQDLSGANVERASRARAAPGVARGPLAARSRIVRDSVGVSIMSRGMAADAFPSAAIMPRAGA